MSRPAAPDRTITHLLSRWSQGERAAADQLMPIVYDELRRLARVYFYRERCDHTLEPTALVHEVYVGLIEQRGIRWVDRSHFFGLAACMMRRVLVDYSRQKALKRRGGDQRRIALDGFDLTGPPRPELLVALDDALRDLERVDPQKALIVELRFFGGLTAEESAECLGISPRTVARRWRRARAALFRELSRADSGNGHAL